jgi:endonuclease YncB( thermonuclease family)
MKTNPRRRLRLFALPLSLTSRPIIEEKVNKEVTKPIAADKYPRVSKQRKIPYAMSKSRRAGLIVLCLLAAVLFVWLDHSFVSPGWRPQPKSQEQAQAHDFERYHTKTFTVVKVVDGDTIDVDISDGSEKHTRIRLLGVDTPETKNPKVGVMYFGPEAAAFTSGLVLGKPVTVYLDNNNNTRGKYGRLLAYVKMPDDRYLNEALLTEGFAYADLRFRHSLYNKYKQLEAGARGQNKGLWENVTRPQLPEWLRQRKPKMLNR